MDILNIAYSCYKITEVQNYVLGKTCISCGKNKKLTCFKQINKGSVERQESCKICVDKKLHENVVSSFKS